MIRKRRLIQMAMAGFIFTGILTLIHPTGGAHCDTLDGPVVASAMQALEKGDVTAVLKWVKKEHEGEIREAFQKTLVVRSKGAEAEALANRYFYETLVRIHRLGEGALYTGLKSAGSVEPSIAEADRALENGKVENLVHEITHLVSTGIRGRFADAFEKKQHAGQGVEAGREFVEAYVGFVHYVERLHMDASDLGEHHATGSEAETHRHRP